MADDITVCAYTVSKIEVESPGAGFTSFSIYFGGVRIFLTPLQVQNLRYQIEVEMKKWASESV